MLSVIFSVMRKNHAVKYLNRNLPLFNTYFVQVVLDEFQNDQNHAAHVLLN